MLVIVHYGEIALKGKNRPLFEQLLVNRIAECFPAVVAKKERGYILLTVKKQSKEEVIAGLQCIPGILYFSFVQESLLSLSAISTTVITMLKKKSFSTFRITTKRMVKQNALRSMDVNRVVGAAVVEALDKKAKMNGADIDVKIKIGKKKAYISVDRYNGVGGMPVNPKQKVVCLLSGGFDSAVAAFLMMKRGCSVVFVHMHNESQQMTAVQDKIERLVAQLNRFQSTGTLYVVPFEELQRAIVTKVPASLRMLVYRRYMLRIAEKIALKERAKVIIVGDSLSQVASQTLSNIASTYAAVALPVLPPLIGMDKTEVMAIARTIGTYELSALPYGDCCTFFMPKNPATSSTINALRKAEGRIGEELFEKVLKEVI